MAFRTGPIEPTLQNTVDIHSMVFDEVKKFSGDTSAVKTALELRDRIVRSPRLYRGAFDHNDRIVGFAKFNDWRRADQISFESLKKQIAYKFDRHKDEQVLPGNPMGIFALTPYAGLPMDDAIEASELLLDDIIEQADGREIRIARFQEGFAGDPAWWATNSRGFKDTLKFGQVAGTLQRLAIRPAGLVDDAPSED